MAGYDVSETRLRCVLPFEAEAAQISVLRRAVVAQLAAWCLVPLVEDARLVVSELATNVLKHVGAGAAATLILEVREGLLRVEAHDRSHEVPSRGQVSRDQESGRGLDLVARLAVNWGTVVTGSGKAVWCDLAAGPSQPVRRAAVVLEGYAQRREGADPRGRAAVLEDSAVRLISDLLHWSVASGRCPDDVLDWAQMRYEAGPGAL